jgi:hypothetical protein
MKKTLSVLIAVAACGMSMAQMTVQPSPELKKLDYLVGEWTTEGDFTMMGATMPIKISTKVVWDGAFLRQESRNELSEGTMTETYMMGYDAEKSRYFSTVYTNMSAVPRNEFGKIEDDKLIMLSEPWDLAGMKFESRTTMWKAGADVMMRLEFKMGDSWAKAGEWTLKKKK